MKRGSFLELEDPKGPGWEEEGGVVVPDHSLKEDYLLEILLLRT